MSTVYRCKLTITDRAGIKCIHRFNVLTDSLADAQSLAATMMEAYQPAVNCQVTSLTVEGIATEFTQLRSDPSGDMHKRLILRNRSVFNSTSKTRGQPGIALSDPEQNLLDYLLGKTDIQPQVYADFEDGFLLNICSIHGDPFETITAVHYSESPRVIDNEKPGSHNFRGLFEDFENPNIMTHATTHLSNGTDPIVYTRKQCHGVNQLNLQGVAVQIVNGLVTGAYSATAVSTIYTHFLLNDWKSGDITLTIFYQSQAVSGGNVKFQLDSTVYGSGDATTIQRSQTATFQPAQNTNIIKNDLFTIPASDVTRGKMLAVKLARLGNDAADTETNATRLLAVKITYQADIPV